MLEEMRIRGLGVIDDALLEFSPGLTVLTGETGAGKTMVVTGLGLLLGGRADAGAVRTDAGTAVVEGRLSVAADAPVARRAAEAGGIVDDEGLLLVRSLSAEGRSRAHVGGRAVPVGVLAELAADLVAVHGQSDQQRLLLPVRQRAALDRFAGEAVAALLTEYATAYAGLREVERQLTEITTRARERAQEADVLRFGLAEVESVDPKPGEDDELAAEEERLAHADTLRSAAAGAHEALLGDPDRSDGVDAVALLAAARRVLEPARGHDPELAGLADRLAEVAVLMTDVAGDLASYAAGVDTDPMRLAAVQERRAELRGLQRKYGDRVEDILAWAAEAAGRLASLDGDDERIATLGTRRVELRRDLGALAGELSAARTAAAQRFGTAVTAELASLAMARATLSVSVRQSEDAEGGLAVGERVLAFGQHGVDEVELLLAAHPGAPPRPLARGASGGELSRVMLAVEVVFAGADPVPTFVFDEVDAGVGGKAAVEIGSRLARLARRAQVLVVTHLPQVAAYADQHLAVAKSSDGAVTRSGIRVLDREGRVRELARMLAGREESETGRAHAEELLAAARAEVAAAGVAAAEVTGPEVTVAGESAGPRVGRRRRAAVR